MLQLETVKEKYCQDFTVAEKKVSEVKLSMKQVKFGHLTVLQQLLLRSESVVTGQCATGGAEREGRLHTKASA